MAVLIYLEVRPFNASDGCGLPVVFALAAYFAGGRIA
jgi:hypothetical protein